VNCLQQDCQLIKLPEAIGRATTFFMGNLSMAFWKTGENYRVSAPTRAEYNQKRGKQGE
jgi:hypothetical protein